MASKNVLLFTLTIFLFLFTIFLFTFTICVTVERYGGRIRSGEQGSRCIRPPSGLTDGTAKQTKENF